MIGKRCPTCGRRKARSDAQNRFYWELVNHIAHTLKPQGDQYSAQSWHIYFRGRFLGHEDIRMPNGRTVTEPKSTSDLDEDKFSDYCERVQQYAAEHGCHLPERVEA